MTKELRLHSGLSNIRVNDLHDGQGGISVHIDSGMDNLMATLDREQQHFLLMYLQERRNPKDQS